MPVYELRCKACEHVFEVYRPHREHGNWPRCRECGGSVRQKISAPLNLHVDNMPSYVCPATGAQVTSRRQRQEIFARHNLMDANDLGPPPALPAPGKPSEVDVPGMGLGSNLDEAPTNAPKMSRRERDALVDDIKRSIEELKDGRQPRGDGPADRA